MQRLAHRLSNRNSDDIADALGEGDGGASSPPNAQSPTLRTPSSRRERKEERKARRAASRSTSKHVVDPPRDASDSEDENAFRAEWHMSRADEKRRMEEFIKHLRQCELCRDEFDYYTYRRFLRARQHDIERATEMWAKHLEWRKEIGADSLLDNFDFPERDAFISLYPQGYCNVDKQGRPVYIQQLGQLQFSKLQKLTTEDRMMKFHVQEYERCLRYILPACSKAAGRHIDQTFAIVDVKGVGLRHFSGAIKQMLGKVLETDQNNYPEMLGKTAIINAGTVINFVWPFVKPFLDKRTQNKIEICPGNYTPVLLRYIDKQNLPEYLGGTSKATLLDDAGPWNDRSLIDAIEADLRKPGPRLRMPDGAPVLSSAASSVSGSSPTAAESFTHAAAPGFPGSELSGRITEEEESQHEAAARVRASSIASELSPRPIGDDDGYESPTEGYASASEGGYWSATESLRSASRSSSRSLPQGFGSRKQQPVAGGGSDSDEEAQSRSPAAAAGEAPTAAGNGVSPSRQAPLPAAAAQGSPSGARTGRQLQQSIAARVGALEERLGAAKASLGRRAPPVVAELGPSAPLLARVEALEAALDVLLASQEEVLRDREESRNSGCCSCCTIM